MWDRDSAEWLVGSEPETATREIPDKGIHLLVEYFP